MSLETQSQVLTVESKVYADPAMSHCLCDIAKHYGFLERTLFNDIVNDEVNDEDFHNAIKKRYQPQYGITARQFNALWAEVTGKISALEENHKDNIKNITKQITRIKKDIAKHKKIVKEGSKPLRKNKKGKIISKPNKYKPQEVANSRRILYQLNNKLYRLEQEKLQSVRLSIVFGTRDFYKKQWTDEKYKIDHAAWRREWDRRRNGHFFCLGSKGETDGNLTCHYVVDGDKECLKVKLPYALEDKYKGEHIYVPVRFHSDRGDEGYYEYFHEAYAKAKKKEDGISYQFLLKENGEWYVHATFTIDRQTQPSYGGVIGVDLNYGLIATTDTNRYGNFECTNNYKYDPEGMSSEHKADMLSLLLDEIVERAKLLGKSIAIEDLELENKKYGSTGSKKYNRKLNMLEYGIIRDLLISKCVKAGVKVGKVNPAYTSVIGRHKYSKFYGISVHNAAALVIARRLMGFKERMPIQIVNVLRGGEESKWETTYRHRHHWAHWSYLCNKTLDKCLTEFNSFNSSNGGSAITVNDLISRVKSRRLSFSSGS